MMKFRLLLFVMMFTGVVTNAQEGVKFEDLTFKEALAKAKAENKLVFMDCYTSWCGPCKKMLNTVFVQKEAGDFFNPRFVNIKYDMEKGEGIELAKQFNVKSFPTFFIIRPDGSIQHKVGGAGSLNSFLGWVERGLYVETGSAVTWKYLSTILKGDGSVSEFYSVAVTNNYQQADTGTKMIHIGNNTRSRIVSKGISAGYSSNSYRGRVKVVKNCKNARNFSQCDSLLLGDKCGAHTFPYLEVANPTAQVEHEATTSKIGEDQIFYCNQRGISTEDAIGLIIKGYAGDVINKMPMEFAVEAQKLLQISLAGSVG